MFKVDDIFPVFRIAFSKNGSLSHYCTAGHLDELFHCKNGFPCADDIVDYQDAFALYQSCIVLVNVQGCFLAVVMDCTSTCMGSCM